MKVYISGAITGTNDYMERFSKAQMYLESKGHYVINPALVNSNLPKDTSYDDYMKMSFCMIDICEAIYLLKGFEKSNGAITELAYAEKKGLSVYHEWEVASPHGYLYL